MTIAEKLQKTIDGKQSIIDSVNAKANTSLPLNCTWENLKLTLDNIESGGGSGETNTLKKLLDNTKSCYYMFYNYKGTSVTDLISYSDTSNVTDMSNMFYNCKALTSVPPLNTSNVTDMKYMFYSCSALTTITQLDTSKVIDMRYMFQRCSALTTIDITYYKISSTGSSSYWCYNCYSLKTIIIRSFSTSYALHSNAFTNCYHLIGTVNATYNPTGAKDAYIYVPRSMVSTLSSATNWSAYADQFRALEDYTVDGTTTGELDESKVNA